MIVVLFKRLAKGDLIGIEISGKEHREIFADFKRQKACYHLPTAASFNAKHTKARALKAFSPFLGLNKCEKFKGANSLKIYLKA